MIGQEDYDFIARLDSAADPKTREAIIKENPSQMPKTFFKMMNNVSKEQTMQYILTLLDDVLQEDKNRVDVLKV